MTKYYPDVIEKYRLFDIAEIVVGFISLISSILTIITFWGKDTNKNLFIPLGLLLLIVLLLFIKVLKLQTVALNRLSVFRIKRAEVILVRMYRKIRSGRLPNLSAITPMGNDSPT